ncbi:MAG: glycosyltransferase [Solirubrobacteraceae bacterium]
MDPWSASTRYRALQHVPRLRERFASVNVSLPHDTLNRAPGVSGRVLYFSRHAARYTMRGAKLLAIADQSDYLLVQRGLYVLGPALIVRALRRFRGPLVFDLDDAVFHISPSLSSKGPAARWLYGAQQATALMKRADAIVVSTPELAEMLPAGLAEPIVLPTIPDPSKFTVVDHSDATPVTIGWAGTLGGLGYLDPLAPVFERLRAEHVAEFEVVCSDPWSGPARFRRWRLEEETSLFNDFAVGIMPLPDTDYTRAKAGFKLLQYMAAGIPVVASPIGVNRELIDRSRAGFLADKRGEWEEALRILATDPALRRELGLRGRAFVERYANLDGQADTLASLLRGADY